MQEWTLPGVADTYDHRHASHLYPLFFGLPEEIERDPKLMAAFLKAAQRRAEFRRRPGCGGMAFGLVQAAQTAASLRNSELTGEALLVLSNNHWLPSMMTLHDPDGIFNADLSGGLPAIVAQDAGHFAAEDD